MKNSALFLLIILSSCIYKQAEKGSGEQGELLPLKHAEGFTIQQMKDYTQLTVLNPWKSGETFAKYYLVKSNDTTVPTDGKKIQIPVQTLVANSATHLEFLQMLGETDRITGVCSAKWIYNPAILQGVKQGKIKDLGESFNLDIENLLMLQPQIVLTSAYNVEDENSKRLQQTGFSMVYNIEWQEKTLLARAEWIKFIAAFFDKSTLADSLYNDIETRYLRAAAAAASVKNRPMILSGQDYRGTWSMPAGRSFNARMFADAGATYYHATDTTTGSLSTGIEAALIHFSEADIWVGVQANSLDELGKIDSKYRLFKAYKTGNVYSYDRRVNGKGGNDYWESAVAHPDLLLSDMIKVLHPDLLPGYELFYMKKLD